MLRKLWIELRSSLYFVPGLLVLGGILLAVAFISIDVSYGQDLGLSKWSRFLDASAEGARGMLSAIAGSMITVAGVAFSVTIVTLSLASTQYTPRILRNFMRDRSNQTVLGVFVGIFTYSLIVLRTIRGGGDGESPFVPLLAVFGAVLLALVSIGFLIFFIHHTAASIQAPYLLNAITDETLAAVDALFPQPVEEAEEEANDTADDASGLSWFGVSALAVGYLQSIDHRALIKFAEEKEVILRLRCEAGQFVMNGMPLLLSSRPLDDAASARIRAMFVIGDFRTVEQDASFGIRQMVDIAMKALSPGVNDTSTAVSCLDYLGAILARLGQRQMESPFPQSKGPTRVLAPEPRFADYAARSFDEVRLSAKGNVAVLLKLLKVICDVSLLISHRGRRGVLLRHARLVREDAAETVRSSYDRGRIDDQMAALRDALNLSPADLPPLTHGH
jgi:uncharacterized membrane protein